MNREGCAILQEGCKLPLLDDFDEPHGETSALIGGWGWGKAQEKRRRICETGWRQTVEVNCADDYCLLMLI
jgi:hypothetical protein